MSAHKARTPRNNGTRLDPVSFVPSPQSRQTISTERPDLDQGIEHRRFCDYWIAQPGQRGLKLDWDATWRNWMRRADAPRTNGNRRQQETDGLFERAAVRLGVEPGSEA